MLNVGVSNLKTKMDLSGTWLLQGFDEGEGESARVFNPEYQPIDWLEAEVPGVVHVDLLKTDKIADPFYRLNELEVGWIENKDWWYRREFDAPKELVSKEKVEIKFHGLDTFAKVWMNGQEVGKANNMFIAWEFDVKHVLRSGKNVLVVKFDSPVRVLKQLEDEKGKLEAIYYTGRAYGRKAQCSFGWDWAPRIVTSGIWQKVELTGYDTAILKQIMARISSLAPKVAKLDLEAEVYSLKQIEAQFIFEVSSKEESFTKTVTKKLNIGENLVRTSLKVVDPKLWWPAGCGEQPLYNYKVTLKSSGKKIDVVSTKIGLRKIDLVQENDREGKSFIFKINGVPIFCKGANWIPADSLLPRVKNQDYEKLLDLAVQAHMNMLRVWGGGIYEKEVFYQLCDEKGILVWQDFMFSCAEYPEEKWFWNIVKKEAEEVVKRLRNHPSVVLWCGNNENDTGFKQGWFGKKKKFYGETIYHKILPEICARLDPTRPYWPSSPFGGDDPNSQESGDRHSWDVWHQWLDYTAYQVDKGRFISEFGLQAPPAMETIESFTEPEDRWSQSKVMEHHNKMVKGTERIYRYLIQHFRVPTSFKKFVLLTQVNQGEALKCGIEHWRRRKFSTSGTLFWQLNDCWPVTSWSVIDYFKRPKAGYYFVKRAYTPVLVSLVKEQDRIDVWVVNDLTKAVQGKLTIKLQDFEGKTYFTKSLEVDVANNSSCKVFSKPLDELPIQDKTKLFFSAELFVEGGLVSMNTLFLEEFKHVTLPKVTFKIKTETADITKKKYRVHIASSKFAKAVHLSLHGVQATFSDNYFDMLPASKKSVLITLDKEIEPSKFGDVLVVSSI